MSRFRTDTLSYNSGLYLISPIFFLAVNFLITVLDYSLSVYDAEFLGKYDAVGHALFYVEDALTHDQKSHALKLYRQSMVCSIIIIKRFINSQVWN